MRKLILTLTTIGITGLLWAQPQGTLRVEVYDLITGNSLNQASVRLVIPTAQSKFTITPLLKVPPASRGEPRKDWFPLRAGGTLRRGLSTAVFCELWLGDWY